MADPIPLDIPVGVVKSTTSTTIQGRWIDTQWVRFKDGYGERIGSYARRLPNLFETVRGMFCWVARNGTPLIAVGTAKRLWSVSDLVQNITPFFKSSELTTPPVPLSNPFFSTAGTKSIIVLHAAHGLGVGQIVRFRGVLHIPNPGIVIANDQEYAVSQIIDQNRYEIVHANNATATVNFGGTAVQYDYEIAAGNDEQVQAFGYGAGPYGDSTYGTPRTGNSFILVSARIWSFDTYGSHLLAMASGDFLYEWDEPANKERAERVANAPAGNFMFVTEERYPVILGADGVPMKMSWPDQNDITNWTPGLDNTANSRTLQHGSKLVAGTHLANTLNIVWSDTSCYLMQYTGSSLIYDTPIAGEVCGLISQTGFSLTPDKVFWMTPMAEFKMYSGAVQDVPNWGDIGDFVQSGINNVMAWKTISFWNPLNNEIWWIYPEGASDEPNRYVMVCADSWAWATGTLERTAASTFLYAGGKPVLAGVAQAPQNNGYLYNHELTFGQAFNQPGYGPLIWYALSGAIQMRGGGTDIEIWHFIPDFQRQNGPVLLTLSAINRPRDAVPLRRFSKVINPLDTIVDVRLSGKYISMGLSNDIPGGGVFEQPDIRFGKSSVVLQPGGGKL